MAVEKKEGKQSAGSPSNGVVTVNDEANPSREEREQYIRNEPGTERLRSERGSVQDGDRKGESA